MQILKHNVKPLHLAIGIASLVIVGIFLFITGCSYNLKNLTFKGVTENETLIVIELTASSGEITGYGCHLTDLGKESHVNIEGEIDCESGKFSIDEFLIGDGSYFGNIKGKIDKEKTNLVGGWTNSLGQQFTVLSLEFTEKSPIEVLNTESARHIKKRATRQGKRLKQRLIGVVKGLFSSDSEE